MLLFLNYFIFWSWLSDKVKFKFRLHTGIRGTPSGLVAQDGHPCTRPLRGLLETSLPLIMTKMAPWVTYRFAFTYTKYF